MDVLLSQWKTFTTTTSEALLTWARPAHHYGKVSPMAAWPLASGHAAFSIAFGYLAFVFIFSAIMKSLNVKIGGLYGFKFLYNICQIMLCSYMAIEAGIQAWKAGYTLMPCEPFVHVNPPIGFVLYIFYLSKILDFMDTFFIIAECRWKQLSFLHVYHHFSIFSFYWLNLNVGYDGDVYLTIVLNGLIHTVMYTYYFVSLHVTEAIWWKSFLTISQMIQFVIMNLQAGYLVYTGCTEYPTNITKAYFYYIVSLLVLFMHFFIQDNFFREKKGGKRDAVKAADKVEAGAEEEDKKASRKKRS
jgi:elongation of very long chain fatty acids protein 4